MSVELDETDLEALKAKLLRCKQDEAYALESCITIIGKDKRPRPFKLYESQRLAVQHTGRINYEVKVRQEGRTTLHMGRAQVKARLQSNFEALIIAHIDTEAPVLFDRLKLMDEALPPLLQGKKKTDQAKAIRYADSNSLIRIVTAGASEYQSSKKGRSGTPEWVHITEAAYIEYLDVLLQGVLGSLPPQGVLILESTSNGPRGAFHAGCVNIKTKGQEIVPGQVWRLGDQVLKFTGLLHHEEYRSDATHFEGVIDEEEERLVSLGATPETLMWRRRKLEELINDPKRSKALSPVKQFKREWPATFDEAFEESGSNFFQPAILRLEREAAKLRAGESEPITLGLMRRNGQRPETVRPTEGNSLTVYELPQDGWTGRYLVFGDVGAGNASSDADALYVGDRLSRRIVAVAYGQLGALRHASLMLSAAEYYFGAYIAWDATGIGSELRPLILQSGYPLDRVFHMRREYKNPDRSTNNDWEWDRDGFGLKWHLGNREVGLSLLRHGIETRSLWVPDVDWYDEAQQFGYNDNGKPEAAPGYHDDRVMALAGWCYVDEALPPPTKAIPLKPFQDANVLRERILRSVRARREAVVYEGMAE